MPSASNVKIEKQINSESGLSEFAGSTLSPLRQAITVIEHKIRNLEKRKAKLESYRDLQNSGKELNSDQKIAVAKYEEVLQTLEFARELCKQFIGIATVSEKDAKKIARKEFAAKSQAELAKVREVLLVQDALNQMGQDNVREDFLLGRNGAIPLSESDLKLLDDIYPVVTPKHEPGDPTAFTNQVQAAAEHLLAVVDGKQKEAFGGTYNQIKEVIGKIHESGYFDQAVKTLHVTESGSLANTYNSSVEYFIDRGIPSTSSCNNVFESYVTEAFPGTHADKVLFTETIKQEVIFEEPENIALETPLPSGPLLSAVRQQQKRQADRSDIVPKKKRRIAASANTSVHMKNYLKQKDKQLHDKRLAILNINKKIKLKTLAILRQQQKHDKKLNELNYQARVDEINYEKNILEMKLRTLIASHSMSGSF